MAKKIDPKTLISFELDKLEQKVQEFQNYLSMNPITAQVTKGSQILLTEDDQDKLHKELVIQIKVQDALFAWMPLLEKLREAQAGKQLETRGDIEVNGLFKHKHT
jgi:hypothetical protein